MEGLGVPVRVEESIGAVEEGEGLAATVSHFRDNIEVVNIRHGLLANERDGDAGSSEDRRGPSEYSNDGRGDHDKQNTTSKAVQLSELICLSQFWRRIMDDLCADETCVIIAGFPEHTMRLVRGRGFFCGVAPTKLGLGTEAVDF
jgi:hypothetical protein